MLADPENEIFVSTISLWEIEVKRSLGKLHISAGPNEMMAAFDFYELPIQSIYLEIFGNLPLLHRDPFDRMLVAQALHEGMTLVTADQWLLRYPVPTMRI